MRRQRFTVPHFGFIRETQLRPAAGKVRAGEIARHPPKRAARVSYLFPSTLWWGFSICALLNATCFKCSELGGQPPSVSLLPATPAAALLLPSSITATSMAGVVTAEQDGTRLSTRKLLFPRPQRGVQGNRELTPEIKDAQRSLCHAGELPCSPHYSHLANSSGKLLLTAVGGRRQSSQHPLTGLLCLPLPRQVTSHTRFLESWEGTGEQSLS